MNRGAILRFAAVSRLGRTGLIAMVYQPAPEDRWRLPPKENRRQEAGGNAGRIRKGVYPWFAVGGLGLVYLALLLDLHSLWAMVLLIWVVADIRRGETWFMQTVLRSQAPLTYWALLATWVLFAVLLVLRDLWPEWRGL